MVDCREDVANSKGAATRSRGTTVSGQSGSTCGSVGSPASRSEVTMSTPAREKAFIRLNQLDLNDAGSPGAASNKKKRGQRAAAGDKNGRGLRQFSMKVCEKVESKGRTTYNEVADELVAEFADISNCDGTPDQQQYEEKNIRRRVYDALNVLMAMDIISKDKKEIQWKGLPRMNLTDIEELKNVRVGIRNRIEKKEAYLQELEEQVSLFTLFGFFSILPPLYTYIYIYVMMMMMMVKKKNLCIFRPMKFVGVQNLIQRNQKLYSSADAPTGGVALPFIIVQTRSHATVEVEISEDMQLVHFDFNSTPFKLHDDNYVLKAMKLCESVTSGNTASVDGGGSETSSHNIFQTPPRSNIPGILKSRAKHGH